VGSSSSSKSPALAEPVRAERIAQFPHCTGKEQVPLKLLQEPIPCFFVDGVNLTILKQQVSGEVELV